MSRVYGSGSPRWWQVVSDGQVALVSGCVVLGVWLERPLPVVVVVVVCLFVRVAPAVCVLCLVGGLAGGLLSVRAWREVLPDHLGPYTGSACLVTDPAPSNGALAVVFEIGGERFEAWARGSPSRRLAAHLAGECALVSGRRRELSGVEARRAAERHVVGGFDIAVVGDWSPGTPLARASNRVRRLFAAGAAHIAAPDDALFAGLVIGDDRAEPATMIADFRAAGMSHLTAVSGQNVAYVLAAAAPLLRRLKSSLRWACTLLLIAWFLALTRFEPSVLRAGVMAAIAVTGTVLGREKPPARVLALAVGVLVLIDPLLVWSVGFWLSVGATAGVALLATPLAKVLPGPAWLRVPAGVTLGAQIGVAPVSLLVFGSLPLVALPANLLAVPVAGFVMLYGLPAGGFGATLVQAPSAVGTRWVAAVAALAARIEPPTPWAILGWVFAVLALSVCVLIRRTQDVDSVVVVGYGKVKGDGTASDHR